MSRLEVPLRGKVLPATGDLLLRAEIDLWLKNASGNWLLQTFRVDSGSDISSMPAYRAKALGLPMPQRGIITPLATPSGKQPTLVRSGLLRLRVEGLSQYEHVIPCHFRGDPDAPPPPGVTANFPRNLLGLAGVVDKLRFTYDGSLTSPITPFGRLIVEEI